jgi:hypothetical protein
MSSQISKTAQKPRLGPRQKELVAFLEFNGGSMWQEDLVAHFVYAGKYQRIFYGRLYGLEEKGIVRTVQEINPKTGRLKKKVYLIK